jgi:hypothetical protein
VQHDDRGGEAHHAARDPDDEAADGLVDQRMHAEQASDNVIGGIKHSAFQGRVGAEGDVRQDRRHEHHQTDAVARTRGGWPCVEDAPEEHQPRGQHGHVHRIMDAVIEQRRVVVRRVLPDRERGDEQRRHWHWPHQKTEDRANGAAARQGRQCATPQRGGQPADQHRLWRRQRN